MVFSSIILRAQQCNQPLIEHVICDITTLDIDGDGDTDGKLDLNLLYFNETGNTVSPSATWSTDPNLRFVLDVDTAIVSVWNLANASDSNNINEYEFILADTSNCGVDPVVVIRLVLAPFSGIELTPFGSDDVNYEVCETHGVEIPKDSGNFRLGFDLFSALIADEKTPTPHLNGTWFEIDINGNIIEELESSIQVVSVPDFPDRLIDNVLKDYRYVVNTDLSNCTTNSSVTEIRVSIVRQVFAGNPVSQEICETSILNGNFNNFVNLRDDIFLIDEEDGGSWSGDQLQISDANDSFINIREIYEEAISSNTTNRFGYISKEFKYEITKRSGVCDNSEAIIPITIFESLRPISLNDDTRAFCREGDITSVQLFDYLNFTEIGNDNYVYPNESEYTFWSYVNGPLATNLVNVSSLGEFNFVNPEGFIPVGTYTFQYTVSPWINAPDLFDRCLLSGSLQERLLNCSHPCDNVTITVEIEIIAQDYAGENTNITLCSSEGTVNLTDLIVSNATEGPVSRTGTWRDASNTTIPESFTIPLSRTEDQIFNFTYSTINSQGCEDSSLLELTAMKAPNAGIANPSVICGETFPIILFNLLSGDPDDTGIWEGPNGFVSTDHFGVIENEEKLLAGTYTYTVEGKGVCVGTFDSEDLELKKRSNLGSDYVEEVCSSLGAINLFDTLGPLANKSGVFSDDSSTGLLSTDGLLDVATLSSGDYIFTYRVSDNLPCDDGEVQLTVRLSREEDVPNAGSNNEITICSNNKTLNLFDVLGGTPEITGTWSGPFGYISNTYLGEFIEGDETLQVLQPGIYTYTIIGKSGCGDKQSESQITVDFVDPPFLEEDFTERFCVEENSVNLFDLLDRNTDRGGRFEVVNIEDESFLMNNGTFDFSTVQEDRTFEFTYTLPSTEFCAENSLIATIEITKIPSPEVPNNVYCILDALVLSDVEIGNNDVWFETLTSDRSFTEDPVLKDEMTFYLETQERGCVSERTEVVFRILNIGETDEASGIDDCVIDFQDVVTPNQDGINDSFTLDIQVDGILGKDFNIPEAFPDYELKIFNRNGVLVYEATRQKAEFDGNSNINTSAGALATGMYFYVFNPNFEDNEPFQGSFYLSK